MLQELESQMKIAGTLGQVSQSQLILAGGDRYSSRPVALARTRLLFLARFVSFALCVPGYVCVGNKLHRFCRHVVVIVRYSTCLLGSCIYCHAA